MMKLGVLFGIMLISSYAAGEFCYNDVESSCDSEPGMSDGVLLANCDAKYGTFDALMNDLQGYANAQISTSFEYLMMSTHFGNFESHRPGFAALYRKLSDRSWENGIDIIKFITQRGGIMDFKQPTRLKRNTRVRRLELTELPSLAKALDTEKQLAEAALHIHNQAQHHAKQDGSVAHYLEEKFLESQAESVRNLAGYATDLKLLLSDHEPAVSVFLFDEYLKSLF